MRDVLDRVSWPLRRWLCDRLVGDNAYTRNVAPIVTPTQWNTASSSARIRIKPFDQEYS